MNREEEPLLLRAVGGEASAKVESHDESTLAARGCCLDCFSASPT